MGPTQVWTGDRRPTSPACPWKNDARQSDFSVSRWLPTLFTWTAFNFVWGRAGLNIVSAFSFRTPRDTVITTKSDVYCTPSEVSTRATLVPFGPTTACGPQWIVFTSLRRCVWFRTGSSSAGFGYRFWKQIQASPVMTDSNLCCQNRVLVNFDLGTTRGLQILVFRWSDDRLFPRLNCFAQMSTSYCQKVDNAGIAVVYPIDCLVSFAYPRLVQTFCRYLPPRVGALSEGISLLDPRYKSSYQFWVGI